MVTVENVEPTADSVSLRKQLHRVSRGQKVRAFALVAPLLLFLLLAFVAPIVLLLTTSVRNPEVVTAMPRTAELIQSWDRTGLPNDRILYTFANELKSARENRAIGRVGKRLNYSISGFRSLVLQTGRQLESVEISQSTVRSELLGIDNRWGQTDYWVAVQEAATPVTDFYLLAALDLKRDTAGDLVAVPDDRSLYIDVMARTFWISFVVTLSCLFLGYPLAYLLATLPTRKSNLLMYLVLLSFYTSLLVRTTAWLVLLQSQGLVNDLGIFLGLYEDRIQLIHNRFGTYVAMVHIFLPFMLLPIFSVMKGIPSQYVRAARSLGAGPVLAFREVYLPQTLPGVAAGCLLVFILSLGVYVTPALVGGPRDQMVSYFIATYTNQTVNWGMASALSVILLLAVMIVFGVYIRLVGLERMRLG